MMDRVIKVLLMVIALGVWALVVTLWVRPAAGLDSAVLQELQDMHTHLEDMNDLLLDFLEGGTVDNSSGMTKG